MRIVLLMVGTLLPLASCCVYGISIVRGRTKPQRMSHLLLLLITALSFVSLLAGHDTSGIWLALVSCVQAVIICLLSIKWGMGGRDQLDWVCLFLCIAGMVLWKMSGQSMVGLIASIVADFIAVLPGLYKTIRLPHTESLWFYLLDTIAATSILVAGPFTVHAALYPAYLLAINTVFVLAIWRPGSSVPIKIE